MIKATIKATGETQYFFPSKSEPGVWHKTTISGCSCKGYTHHQHCWHYDRVQAETKAARVEAFRQVDAWLASVPVAQAAATVDLAAWDRYYAELHEINQRAMLETAAATVAQQPGVLVVLAAGMARARVQAEQEARWSRYQDMRASGW